MKKIISAVFISALSICFCFQQSTAQCVIDSSQTQAGLHPDTLQNGTVNQFYSEDVTFVLITDTLGLTITNFLIQSINGLPLGMQWSCDHAANGCNYNPAQSLYGCVRLYGTPVLAGAYPLSVTVVATVAFIGNQTFNFNTNLIIDPATVSNAGFTLTNALGCAPLTVGFTNNLPNQQYYNWNFGNGDSSLLQSPAAVTYTSAGDYVITQTSSADTSTNYYLTAVKIDSIPNNAGFLDTPDMYILITNQSGATVYDSHPSVSNTNPPVTFSFPAIQLNNENYTIHVWDEDSGLTLPDDDLGSIIFQGHSASGIAIATLTGVSGRLRIEYTISVVPPIQVVAVDTVHVYPAAVAPLITVNEPLTFCDGDSAHLISNYATGNQWYQNGNFMIGEANQTLLVTAAGTYFDVQTNAFGCSDTSISYTVTINLPPPFPNFGITGNVLTANVFGTFSYQWYLNDSVISGATTNSYTVLISGNYRLQITDTNGCSRKSFPIFVVATGITSLVSEELVSIFPNPAQAEVRFTLGGEKFRLQINTIQGKCLFNSDQPQNVFNLNCSDWAKGIYSVKFSTDYYTSTQKLIVE